MASTRILMRKTNLENLWKQGYLSVTHLLTLLRTAQIKVRFCLLGTEMHNLSGATLERLFICRCPLRVDLMGCSWSGSEFFKREGARSVLSSLSPWLLSTE